MEIRKMRTYIKKTFPLRKNYDFMNGLNAVVGVVAYISKTLE
jgi:hypothetical protein